MSYQILVLPAAARAIKKLPPEAKRRIQAAVELLAEDPRPPAAKKLTGRPEWRVRTGDYRVLYRIQDDVLTVVIVHAGHRREVYDK
ncbi:MULTISPECIES: type II toxin-antitoxin system RelE/ParE family toxin [Pseudoclavibacter]|uniref:type II toxin-antitoxin system RelE family toxin n=1 Tax=Pseudoclavibacter TaxID=255204 RepID=UPI000CE8B435|nr:MULTISPECIES: type II toxin-antitoxin system RelE/ParE family toxin [Pseudoclavibacter]MBS3178618.1 type II toxin-antitoxin system RelE/ParE family toxin [Pseudoclavibacter sp. Marseille-Q4354]NYF15049.1 mRNA interferase RelE/StbE [Pseudoclavibacter sp. JAI123]PPG42213.1 plasmid stabilization protein [Pseudoclavibacter sp. RFBA6]